MTCKNIYPELQAWIDRNAAFRRQEQAIAARIDQATGLGLNEFYFLYYLSKCPERRMRVQEAQELIQMSQSAMSRLIQRLECTRTSRMPVTTPMSKLPKPSEIF